MTAATAFEPACASAERPRAHGKYVFVGDRKFYVRGVTYGTFRSDGSGNEFHLAQAVRDFREMSACGVNAVRTYSVPPRWFLDVAYNYNLRVMVGIPWEQHIAFLENAQCAQSIEQRVRAVVRSFAEHPAVLCYAVGNEIPAPIVRWYGHRRIEDFLHRLCQAAKAEDPGGLVSYINYPTTEYLELPFLDLVGFNVYLELEDRFQAYLARLQNLAGERPLIIAELGLDSRRHGEGEQARALNSQIRTAFGAGCAGLFVFSWTDEWHRGGYDIQDWDFGLTRRDRTPKESLAAVQRAFAEAPFPASRKWPRISVVVCTYNGNRTIRECLAGLTRLRYPNFEVILVDDGSTLPMASIAAEYGVLVIRTQNQGLSSARNAGLEAATGEIVAYIDDDAYPDPDWLTYLADGFLRTRHAGIGGPNIAPAGDGRIADCVANAPGGPVHVLISDELAEHIPGCNMAFRKAALQAIGGFDPRFRVAGDDVDVCWRLQHLGWTLGFNPAAMVWHHRRDSVRAYWRQQVGYGRAEALLAEKWPEKYNDAGHLSWAGRIYGKGLTLGFGQIKRIYHGVWGSAAFQRIYHSGPNSLFSVLLMPEWYLLVLLQAALAALSLHWQRLWLAAPLFGLAVIASLAQAWRSAAAARFSAPPRSEPERIRMHALVALLYLIQPLARLRGRLRFGLSPWRCPRVNAKCIPRSKSFQFWSETWQTAERRLESLENSLRTQGAIPLRGSDYERWDLEVRGGALGACRLRMAIEEHGAGRQMIRFRCWPHFPSAGLTCISISALAAAVAALDGALGAFAFFAALAGFTAYRAIKQAGARMAAIREAIHAQGLHEIARKPAQRAAQPESYPHRVQREQVQ